MLVGHFNIPSVKWLFSSLNHILLAYLFFLLICSFLVILDMSPLLDTCTENIVFNGDF